MSYNEYLDLYLSAQDNKNSKYHVVLFDVKDSKKIPLDERKKLQLDLFYISEYIYKYLDNKSLKENKDILIKDSRFYRPWNMHSNLDGNFCDPFIYGDTIAFTILRDSIDINEIINLFNKLKNELNIKEEFHISNGFYETNEYGEGNTKFYRGYCLHILSILHKKETQKQLQKLKIK